MQTNSIKRPSLGLYLTEGFRALKERVQSISFRKEYTPTQLGDGHPVLVIPGFLTNDASCKPLRNFITRIGYTAYPWGLGRNYANVEDLEVLKAKMDTLYQKHGEKMSLIGWSLGGVYARELAKAKPDLVRQVITMGSPFGGLQAPNNANWIYNLLKGKKAQELDQAWVATIPSPAPVPTTALYSKKDGIVSYKVCQELKEDATHRNVETQSSHLGMGFNKEILRIIAEVLPKYADRKDRKSVV